MSQLHSVVLLLNLVDLSKLVLGLKAIEAQCIASHPGFLDNENLLGRWFQVYKFVVHPPDNISSSTMSCPQFNITWASPLDLERYKIAYRNENVFQFSKASLLFETEFITGVITGEKRVKFIAWDPELSLYHNPYMAYEVRVYKELSYNYMLTYTCTTMDTRWLLSRKRNPSKEELEIVISFIDEVKGMHRKQFCV